MYVLVLGGGVVGVTTAYYLAADGHRVTVLEQDGQLACRASRYNGGMIAPGHAFAWASPAAPEMLVRSLFGSKTAIRVRVSADLSLYPWGLRFLRECTTRRSNHNTEVTMRLCRYSQRQLDTLAATEGIEFAATNDGALYLHRDRKSLATAARRFPVLIAEGMRPRMLTPDECRAAEPALAPAKGRLTGGVFIPSDASGDCQAFTRALADRCRRMGVEFRTGVKVEALVGEHDRVDHIASTTGLLTADAYVLALGAQSAGLARTVGQRLPVYPVRGLTATFPIIDPSACPRLPGVDEHFLVAWSNQGSVLRVSSTAEFGARNRPPTPKDVTRIRAAARDLFPEAADYAAGDYGVGFRPLTPDDRPIIGSGRHRNLVYNTGHGHLGWTMSCGSGRLVADLIAGRRPGVDAAAFAPQRWHGRNGDGVSSRPERVTRKQ